MENQNHTPEMVRTEKPKMSRKQKKRILMALLIVLVVGIALRISYSAYEKHIFAELKQYSNLPAYTVDDIPAMETQFGYRFYYHNRTNDYTDVPEIDNGERPEFVDIFSDYHSATNMTIMMYSSGEKAKSVYSYWTRAAKPVYAYRDGDFRVFVSKKEFGISGDSLTFSQEAYILNGTNPYSIYMYKILFSETGFKNDIMSIYNELAQVREQ